VTAPAAPVEAAPPPPPVAAPAPEPAAAVSVAGAKPQPAPAAPAPPPASRGALAPKIWVPVLAAVVLILLYLFTQGGGH
jgi:hypothetical protein